MMTEAHSLIRPLTDHRLVMIGRAPETEAEATLVTRLMEALGLGERVVVEPLDLEAAFAPRPLGVIALGEAAASQVLGVPVHARALGSRWRRRGAEVLIADPIRALVGDAARKRSLWQGLQGLLPLLEVGAAADAGMARLRRRGDGLRAARDLGALQRQRRARRVSRSRLRVPALPAPGEPRARRDAPRP